MGKQCFICGREIAPRTAFTMQGERSYHPNCASDPEHAWSIALADRDRRIESLEAALRETYALVKRNFVTLDPSGMYTNEVPPGAQVRIKAALREHIDATLATPPTKDEDE